MPIRVYWDSCVFISRLQGDPVNIEVLEWITDEAVAGRVQIVTSAFTLAEVVFLNRDCTEEQLAQDAKTISDFFQNDYIFVVQLNSQIASAAAIIGHKYHVKPPDAVHLATAIAAECQVVHTYDESKLLPLTGQVGSPPLTIEKPGRNFQRALPFPADEPSEGATDSDGPAAAGSLIRFGRKIEKFIRRGAWSLPVNRRWGQPASFGE